MIDWLNSTPEMTSASASTSVFPSTPRQSCPHPVAQRPPSLQKLSIKLPRLRTRPWRWGVLTRESPRVRTRRGRWSMPTSKRLCAPSRCQPERRQPYATQAAPPRRRCTRTGVPWTRTCTAYITGPSCTTGIRGSWKIFSCAPAIAVRTRRIRRAFRLHGIGAHAATSLLFVGSRAATSRWSSCRHCDAFWTCPAHRHFHRAAHRHCGWRGRPVLASCPLPYLVPRLLPKYSWAVPTHWRCASCWAARRRWLSSQTRPGAGEAGASGGPGEKRREALAHSLEVHEAMIN